MTMNRAILRLAVAIHQHLDPQPDLALRYGLPQGDWQEYERLLQHLGFAQQRGWNAAIRHCQQNLRALLGRLENDIRDIAKCVDLDRLPRLVASIRDIYDDVRSLQDDFVAVEWNMRHKTLSVTTPPIELEEIYLGPFRLELDWNGLNGDSRYLVIALDPQPAAEDEHVTHPHVQDQVLCEGDGHAAIRFALQQGRLVDFFALVHNILQTYNSAGPHVSLDRWFGDTCADCGDRMCEDDAVTCQACDSTLCSNCYYSCARCERALCSECGASCPVCDRVFCSRCLTRCSDCRIPVCRGCRTDERCQICHAKHHDQTAEQSISESGHQAGTTVQSHGLGQVAVPA